jgi:hypothetical protein
VCRECLLATQRASLALRGGVHRAVDTLGDRRCAPGACQQGCGDRGGELVGEIGLCQKAGVDWRVGLEFIVDRGSGLAELDGALRQIGTG